MSQLFPEYPTIRLPTIAALINGLENGYRAEIVEGYCSTDRDIPGTRLIHRGKGRKGNRLIVRDPQGKVVWDHNSAETYRENGEVLRWVENQWGRIWEKVMKPSFTAKRTDAGATPWEKKFFTAQDAKQAIQNLASRPEFQDAWFSIQNKKGRIVGSVHLEPGEAHE